MKTHTSIYRLPELQLIIVLLLGVAFPFVSALMLHSAFIPSNDSWVYETMASNLLQHGYLNGFGYVQASAAPQLISVIPLLILFKSSSSAYFIYALLISTSTLIGVYFLSRKFFDPWVSVLVASALIISSGYMETSTTFMTDIPALCMIVWSLFFGLKSISELNRINTNELLLCLFFGAIATDIRQWSIAAPLSVLFSLYLKMPTHRKQLSIYGVSFILINFLILRYTSGGVTAYSLSRFIPTSYSIQRSIQSFSSLSLALVPILIVSLVSTRNTFLRFIALAAGVFFAPIFPSLLIGDLTTQYGSGLSLLVAGSPPIFFSRGIWYTLNFLAGASEIIMTSDFIATLRKFFKNYGNIDVCVIILNTFILIYVTELVLLTKATMFDRYTWPLVVPVAIILLKTRRNNVLSRRNLLLVITFTCGIFIIQSLQMENYFAFNAATWSASNNIAAHGVPLESIDGGYAFMGLQQHLGNESVNLKIPDGIDWWSSLFPNSKLEGIVSSSILEKTGYKLIGIQKYKSFGFFGAQRIYYEYLVH